MKKLSKAKLSFRIYTNLSELVSNWSTLQLTLASDKTYTYYFVYNVGMIALFIYICEH